jgi:signal transduction histidine kinase
MPEYDLNFKLLFESSPDVLLVLLPDAPRYTMIAATEARLRATFASREQTIGRGLFELFPDNPDDAGATGSANLRASLDRVLATRAPDTMAVQKYDIREADGTYTVKYWSPRNIPVLAPNGDVQYILHRVEDVSELVAASEVGKALEDRTGAMEREVIKRSRELAEANRNLRDANIKLGELDAAKTTFFNNISHEFRTPLTLMLGPIEEALADTANPLNAMQAERIRLAHNNTLRLFKLVNALLDFSRLEAGRSHAHFAPIDLGGFSAELAGMFTSAMDKAGIALLIDCPPASQPAWVDREMWEKIVPNLVSNALKFTLEGSIIVRFREVGDAFVLEVADTGVGIAPEELPRIFDRFHRVAKTKARTHEGTGIGLSLVRELVHLHGGRVTVGSQIDIGTTFRVEIPIGYAHLPPESVSMQAADPRMSRDVVAHVKEVSRWNSKAEFAGDALTSADVTPDGGKKISAKAPRDHVLIVDDNPDLRQYLAGLLAPDYDITVAADGQAALETIAVRKPNIVVSDVMMPRVDGFELVRRLRDDADTAALPVILLSARAGEESAIDGLDAGADDYLVKPFSAREFLARVRTHAQLARTRQEWIEKLERANRELDAFSYSVSHDLRAPLRTIDGYGRALANEFGAMLNTNGREYVDKIIDGTQRMGAIIEALISLAVVARAPLQRETVDLSALAKTIVDDLRQAEPQRDVRVHIDDGLSAHGDAKLLGVVLVNLFSNAWKFTARTATPEIHFMRYAAAEFTFVVCDNGAGFDVQKASQLFAPFQRLHNPKEFAGTGIGLATVQRVIERHGGRIWAEAKPGLGASFYFSIPEHDE